jgi:cellulase (glycosyl hydrolase family 5)
LNHGNPAAPPVPSGLAELRQPDLAALVRLAEAMAPTQRTPVVRLEGPRHAKALQPARERPGCPHCGALPLRLRLHRPRHLWRFLVPVAVALLAVAAILAYDTNPGRDANLPAATGPYVWPHGAPIGITLSGLQAFLFGPVNVTTMENQIRAAKDDWHANTIRLQVIQDKLVGADGHHYRPAYMAYVRQVTNFGLRLGLTMVLNAQTEVCTGYALSEPLPDHATSVFWQQMMRWYKNNPRVVFDLFNEPRKTSWAQWKAATQPLITLIRAAGARNQIWVDGENWGSTLEGVPILHDPLHDIVYTIHHPGSDRGGTGPAPTTAQLDAAFGDLAARGVPIVDAEFANYTGSYDWFRPGPNVRRYLAYVTAHHIGLLAWSLLPGALNSTLDYASVSHEPQGDGALLRTWFAEVSYPGPHSRKSPSPVSAQLTRHP